VGSKFLSLFFENHNFLTTNARKVIKASKDADFSLVKKNIGP